MRNCFNSILVKTFTKYLINENIKHSLKYQLKILTIHFISELLMIVNGIYVDDKLIFHPFMG